MAKAKKPTKKRKIQVVKVERPAHPEAPTLVTLAVHEPIPLPPVELPSPPVELEVTEFNDYAKEQSSKDAGVLAWLRAHLW